MIRQTYAQINGLNLIELVEQSLILATEQEPDPAPPPQEKILDTTAVMDNAAALRCEWNLRSARQ
jgi:hypothetical protein